MNRRSGIGLFGMLAIATAILTLITWLLASIGVSQLAAGMVLLAIGALAVMAATRRRL